VCPQHIYWSDNGELVVVATETSYFVLRFNRELVQKYFDQGVEISDQGELLCSTLAFGT
jgi:coatomer subunit beta'